MVFVLLRMFPVAGRRGRLDPRPLSAYTSYREVVKPPTAGRPRPHPGIFGKPRKATRYLVGNPLFAIEMTRHAIGAALYAPSRVRVHEVEDGKTCVEYDLPSSLFGPFKGDRVSRVATMLDRRPEDLVTTAAARS